MPKDRRHIEVPGIAQRAIVTSSYAMIIASAGHPSSSNAPSLT
jgi:hypothetical protein